MFVHSTQDIHASHINKSLHWAWVMNDESHARCAMLHRLSQHTTRKQGGTWRYNALMLAFSLQTLGSFFNYFFLSNLKWKGLSVCLLWFIKKNVILNNNLEIYLNNNLEIYSIKIENILCLHEILNFEWIESLWEKSKTPISYLTIAK
jgi:hypothetical protein